MQISSLKVEAWVSLTPSLSVISLFPTLAPEALTTTPAEAKRLASPLSPSRLECFKCRGVRISISVSRQFKGCIYSSFMRERSEVPVFLLVSSLFPILTPIGRRSSFFFMSSFMSLFSPAWMPKLCFCCVVFTATNRKKAAVFKCSHWHPGDVTSWTWQDRGN